MLTGSSVFSATSIWEMCAHHLHTPPTPPSDRRGEGVPPALERLILDCLAKDPAQRPESVADELGKLSRMHRWPAERAAEWWRNWRASAGRRQWTTAGVDDLRIG